MTDFPPMPTAWQPHRRRWGFVWGAAALLMFSVLFTFASGLLFASAVWWMATDPIEGMAALFLGAAGYFAAVLAAIFALLAIVSVRSDGVPVAAQPVVITAAVLCFLASAAVPVLVFIRATS